ncbi:MAG: 5-formyltetrahydrofolate cyclo-ligase [Candidatus Arcticimaribacter sp.]
MSTILTMDKSQIRKQYKELREQLSEEDIINKSLLIANRCLELDVWSEQVFHLFLTIEDQKEIDTSLIITLLQGKDKEIVVPKITGETRLKHFLLTDQTRFKKNVWGIPEPVPGIEIDVPKIDVVFVPLLAFDSKGSRIGYGKGFYDRFLASCKPNCIKIGLSLFEENKIDFVSETTDIGLDYCVTPDQVYSYL